MISRLFRYLAPGAALLLALSACGGGGSASPAPAPGSVATATPGTAAATLRIVVPAATGTSSLQRNPAFVSSGAQSIALAIYAVTSSGISVAALSTTNVDLTSTSPNCTGTQSLTCSIVIAAPLGTISIGATLYAGTGETGAVLATVVPSAQHEFTIVQNTQNTIGISLSGIPASLTLSVAPAFIAPGTASTATISAVARDAANNQIIGAAGYAQPIAITDLDTSGFTSLSSTMIGTPQSTVNLAYTGGAINGTSFILSGSYPASPTPLSATVSIAILSNGVVSLSRTTLAFLSLNDGPLDVSYSEGSYSGSFSYNPTPCNGVVTITSDPGVLHVSPAGAGECTFVVSDQNSHSASVAVTVNQTTFSAQ